jgi:hypothetical protein
VRNKKGVSSDFAFAVFKSLAAFVPAYGQMANGLGHDEFLNYS